MNASLFLAVAVLSSVFSSNLGVPVFNRRQTAPEDEPLCPDSRAVERSEFSNTNDGSVCNATCRLPRLSFAGIPYGEIRVVETAQCCDSYTREGSSNEGFVCVPSQTTQPSTTQPPATSSTTSPSVILPPVVQCPSSGIRASSVYISLSNVCAQQCTFELPGFGIIFQLITYECCEGYTSTSQPNGLECLPPATGATVSTGTTATIGTTVPIGTTATIGTAASAGTTAIIGTTASAGTTATTGTTEPTGESAVPRCTSDDRSRSTYVNVEPNSLCEVQCFTQSSFAGNSFGPKNVQTRYQCCPGYNAERVYPNHPSNFDYQCVRV